MIKLPRNASFFYMNYFTIASHDSRGKYLARFDDTFCSGIVPLLIDSDLELFLNHAEGHYVLKITIKSFLMIFCRSLHVYNYDHL